METYYQMVNSWQMYVVCGSILVFLAAMCIVMLRKSYQLGKKAGMPVSVLKKVVISSATFTVLPAVSILIGMLALSGTLGVPMAWLRLSVIGALQYELQVTDIALQALGYGGVGDLNVISASDFATIALIMAVGIISGLLCCIFVIKRYLHRIEGEQKQQSASGDEPKKKGFASYATICMFVGLCSTYFGAYIGDGVRNRNFLPFVIACISGTCMLLFEKLSSRKGLAWLDNFALATSMIIGMACAVLYRQFLA